MSTPPAAATSPKTDKSPAKSPSKSPQQQAAVNVGDTGVLEPEHWQQLAEMSGDANANEGRKYSVTSSIFEYRKLHGRTYHREIGSAQYWAANDERQSELLDLNHHCLTLGIGGKLHLAPIDPSKITKALDIGTGTGIWAIEIEDCTQEWTFAPDSADYIHIRWLVGAIPDWYRFFSEAYKTCKPGGWVESFEPSGIITSDDGTVKENSALDQWGKIFIEGGKKLGMSFTVYEDELQLKAMEAAGFVDIQQFEYKSPIGGWPKDPATKELGQFSKLAFLADPEGFVLFVANTIGWTEQEIQVYLAHARKEIHSGKHHPYFKQRVVWGRKPEE
ncbi:hypothetical protein FLONG3_586 [Fusarium longipes]|uniref:Demethylmenaquinone methyltransferase n=1 Tax=Fusarium longipes TaxID=694270 RepID=A0A395T9U9_9HYPO|nr:hypothetical protein FLONG3_586 [Fusarium longipes]